MLELKYHTISPYVKDQTRITALSSGSHFGVQEGQEHYMERLERFLNVLGEPKITDTYRFMRHREYPDIDREKVQGNFGLMSDILLSDTFRQHKGIEEKYRRGQMNLFDMNRIGDPATRLHLSMSRGYERHLIEHFGRLDSEYLDRSILKPVIL